MAHRDAPITERDTLHIIGRGTLIVTRGNHQQAARQETTHSRNSNT
ncbi:MAG: hypothetical protein ABI670_11330 [Chloroflexota bacterium]